MAKKPKVKKTQAVRKDPNVSDAVRPDPLEKQRIAVRALLQKDPTGKSVHDELHVAVKSRAEAIWLQTGGTHGHQESDWRQAREELGIPPEVIV
ncbi:MAG: DUF2934 domain-containing protein [Thermoguttaceae bacterium]